MVVGRFPGFRIFVEKSYGGLSFLSLCLQGAGADRSVSGQTGFHSGDEPDCRVSGDVAGKVSGDYDLFLLDGQSCAFHFVRHEGGLPRFHGAVLSTDCDVVGGTAGEGGGVRAMEV